MRQNGRHPITDRFLALRSEPFTLGLLRLLWRLLTLSIVNLLIALVVLLSMLIQEASPQLTGSDVVVTLIILGGYFGYIFLAGLYPFTLGLLARQESPGGASESSSRAARLVRRMALAMAAEGRSPARVLNLAIRGAKRFQLTYRKGHLVVRISNYALRLVALYVAFLVSIMAFAATVLVYCLIVACYAAAAWAPLSYTDDQLRELHESYFLLALGLMFIIGTDLIVWLKLWLAKVMSTTRTVLSALLIVVDVVATTALFVLASDPGAGARYTPAEAVGAGLAVGLIMVFVVDLGQAALSLMTALRQVAPEAGPDYAFWQYGFRTRSAATEFFNEVRSFLRPSGERGRSSDVRTERTAGEE